MPNRRKQRRWRRSHCHGGNAAQPVQQAQPIGLPTAAGTKTAGLWADASRGELLLIRKAIRERWDMPEARRLTLLHEIYPLSDTDDVRLVLAVTRVFLDAQEANMEEERRELLSRQGAG
jgi:hypothetical protein